MATFSDDFNRPNSSDLGANWLEVSGDWSITGSQLSPGSAGGTIIARATAAMDSADHYARVTITATTAASHGLWIRGNPTGGLTSGYLLRNDGSSWDLFSVTGGSFSVIGTYTAAAVAGDVVRLQAVGTAIKGIINGVDRITATDSSVTTGTSVGLRSESTSSIRFDDFDAADITSSITFTLTSASDTETAQAFSGSKSATLSPAAETGTVQALTTAKAVALTLTGETSAAQTLTGAKAVALSATASTETAQPLTGAKTLVLIPALETDTARPIVAAGPVLDVDLRFVIGPPAKSPWTARPPQTSGWEVGAPC